MIFNHYVFAGLLLAFLMTFGGGYSLGGKHAREHAEALKLQAVAKAQEQAAEQAKADQQTAQVYEAARETVRTVYVKIKEKAHENIEKHHDYADCGLDADGLRIYNHNPNRHEIAASGADG